MLKPIVSLYSMDNTGTPRTKAPASQTIVIIPMIKICIQNNRKKSLFCRSFHIIDILAIIGLNIKLFSNPITNTGMAIKP